VVDATSRVLEFELDGCNEGELLEVGLKGGGDDDMMGEKCR